MIAKLFFLALLLAAAAAHAASHRQPPPSGAFPGAPAQYTKFTSRELTRGFLGLAFGSDLRLGVRPKGIRRFDRNITAFVASDASVDRKAAMEKIIAEYGMVTPNLHISLAPDEDDADLVVHLIDETKFKTALVDAFGAGVAEAFVRRTDPQCMTSVKSRGDGVILRSVSFVIADQGDKVFLDCAYHEMLHALGLSNHDQSNPWTTLNQRRVVGYLTAYDRTLLTLLYDPRLQPGMTGAEVRRVLPALIAAQPATAK
jgi:Protein of unknown function (DUF2927)